MDQQYQQPLYMLYRGAGQTLLELHPAYTSQLRFV